MRLAYLKGPLGKRDAGRAPAGTGPPAAGIIATIPVSVPPSRLAVAPQTIDFGNHAVGTTSIRQMTVTNVSDDALSITG